MQLFILQGKGQLTTVRTCFVAFFFNAHVQFLFLLCLYVVLLKAFILFSTSHYQLLLATGVEFRAWVRPNSLLLCRTSDENMLPSCLSVGGLTEGPLNQKGVPVLLRRYHSYKLQPSCCLYFFDTFHYFREIKLFAVFICFLFIYSYCVNVKPDYVFRCSTVEYIQLMCFFLWTPGQK